MRKLESCLYDEKKSTKHLRIASVTMQCDLNPEINCNRLAAMVHNIKQAHPDVDLILFGETILGWYARSCCSHHK